jgi:hypothetical protein
MGRSLENEDQSARQAENAKKAREAQAAERARKAKRMLFDIISQLLTNRV